MKKLLLGFTFLVSMSTFGASSDCSVYVNGGLNFGESGRDRVERAIKSKNYTVTTNFEEARFLLNRKVLNGATVSTNSCHGPDKRSGYLSYRIGLVEIATEEYRITEGRDDEGFFCAKRSKAIKDAISQLPKCENY